MDTKTTAYKTGQIQQLSESEVVYHLVPDELERLMAFDAYYFDEENARPRHKVRADRNERALQDGVPVPQVDRRKTLRSAEDRRAQRA